MLPYLDEARVRALLRLEDLMPVMERALIDLSAGRVAARGQRHDHVAVAVHGEEGDPGLPDAVEGRPAPRAADDRHRRGHHHGQHDRAR